MKVKQWNEDEQIAMHIQRQKRLEEELDAIRVIVARWWESEMSDDVALVAIKEVLERTQKRNERTHD